MKDDNRPLGQQSMGNWTPDEDPNKLSQALRSVKDGAVGGAKELWGGATSIWKSMTERRDYQQDRSLNGNSGLNVNGSTPVNQTRNPNPNPSNAPTASTSLLGGKRRG